jgi:hypothetical protein
MTVKVRGGGSGAGGALAELTRFAHYRSWPNLGNTAEETYPEHGLAINGAAFSTVGNAPTRSYSITDQRRIWTLSPTLVAGSGMFWKGISTGGTLQEQAVSFRDTALALETATPLGVPFATVVGCWLRKANNVNLCTARQGFGFVSGGLSPLGQARRVPLVGIYGDGANGFRLGSVHCPDGTAVNDVAGVGFNDADAGFVQPSVLLNPGLNWFHVKVKMSPATPTTPAAVGIYLDGALKVSFFTSTNFPRGSNAANNGYQQIESICFADFDTVTQLNGWLASEWEQYYDTDLTL